MAKLAEVSSAPDAKQNVTNLTLQPAVIKPDNPFIFSTGNVRLKTRHLISKEPVIGSVSSDALVLASHVWKKFLFPPWEEENGAASLAQKEIDCSEDDPVALLILLNIAHLKFRLIPAALSYLELYNMAVLCDQYDCVQLVQPWLEKWLQDEELRSLKEGIGWLFIAWVFGRDVVFENLAAQTAKQLHVNANGQFIDITGRLIPSNYMPPGIIESMLEIRHATVEKLLDIPYSQIPAYERRFVGAVCQHGNGPACDAMIYGSLTLYLAKLNLWPKKFPQNVCWNVEMLASMISMIKIFSLPGYADHMSCGKRNYAEDVATILSSMPNPILDSHRVHMKAQRGETTEEYDIEKEDSN